MFKPFSDYKRQSAKPFYEKAEEKYPRPLPFVERRRVFDDPSDQEISEELFVKHLNFSQRLWVPVNSNAFQQVVDILVTIIIACRLFGHKGIRYLLCCDTYWIGNVPKVFEHIIDDSLKSDWDSRNQRKFRCDPEYRPPTYDSQPIKASTLDELYRNLQVPEECCSEDSEAETACTKPDYAELWLIKDSEEFAR